ncbi:PaaI family thioesterase [Christensenellaceae bacterium OttesenSCG-928-M15]|nr:PaaI family thioesterase [Christensenellaceae bacterium OttesenSCG-928-M15]
METERFIAYFNEHDACSNTLGIRLLHVGHGAAEAEMPVTSQNSNFMGALHGGALATLTDITAGCCTYYRKKLCVTLDTSVQYLKGIRSGKATARAKEIHAGGHISVSRVDVYDDENNLCCAATVTMYLTDKPLTGPIAEFQ